MFSAIALSLALLVRQRTATTPPPPTQPPAAQPAPPPATDGTGVPQAAPSRPCGLDASGNYHVGCGVTSPKVIYQVDPEFSEEARRSKISGMTLVGLIVDADGSSTNVHIRRSMTNSVDKKHRKVALALDQKALDAVKKYRFEPATYQGKPVPIELNVEVNFQIF